MMYDWLGVNKVELGVMTELLLRGAQTEGELRGRAARMDPIADLTALRPIVDSLKQKGLIVSLTPEGRGHVLTHALYLPQEMESLKAQFRSVAGGAEVAAHPPHVATRIAPTSVQTAPIARGALVTEPARRSDQVADDVESLRAEVTQLRRDLDELTEQVRRTEESLRDIRDSLGG
jgi:hypothetical protein